MATKCWKKLFRCKRLSEASSTDTELARCLTTLDLTALGIGTTLGAGIYVVVGQVAKEVAGPAVVISFFVAAVASILAGLCYAEFGARVPKSGSAYIYSYVTVGELWAFVIGWNLVLEYVIGTASVARAFSAYLDSLVDDAISKFFSARISIDVPSLSSYPDVFALAIILLLTFVLLFGMKESAILANTFTAINLLVVTYLIICGLFKLDFNNWSIDPQEVKGVNATIVGQGGFMPFGIQGMFSGAAACFYAFVGFDIIATTGEEVKNPQKAIPLSIIASLLVCFVAYFAVSSIITLMVPYYTLDVEAPLPQVFRDVGWSVAEYVIAVGAVCGLMTSLLGGIIPMPRVVYAMAHDGLLFRFLAYVSVRFKTPIVATAVSGVLAALMAMLLDITELVEMMSIGTLLAYTLVAACVIILRYDVTQLQESGVQSGEKIQDIYPERQETVEGSCCCSANLDPTPTSSLRVRILLGTASILMVFFSVISLLLGEEIGSGVWWALLLLILPAVATVILMLVIARQPQNRGKLYFKVPLLPYLPAISMLVNIYLMIQLKPMTWVRFAIWMAVGFLIYFGYGIWHSSENEPHDVDFPGGQAEKGSRDNSYATNGKETSLSQPNFNYENSDERSTLLVKPAL